MTLFDGEPQPLEAPPSPQRRRATRGWYLLIVGFIVTLALGVLPVPYVIERPGPAFDTLGTDQQLTAADGDEQSLGDEGDDDGAPLISISGHDTYPTDGTLDLLTVRTFGRPGQLPGWMEVTRSWFSPRDAAIPVDAAYPPNVSVDEVTERSDQLMTQSQNAAIAAALTQQGIDVAATMTVVGAEPGGPADGVLHDGDEVEAVDGHDVSSVDQLRDDLNDTAAKSSVTLTVRRDGGDADIAITPRDGQGGRELGVLLTTTFDFPFTVDIDLKNVGGPSAGMMMALGIIDKITPGSLTGGEQIAGTGTITQDGVVGPIGGIRQKMYGARDVSAQWFLAPASNCDEAAGHIPDGLHVVSVETLDDAVDAVTAIADGDTDSLPSCS